jgi:hypothetical protein
VDKLAEIKRLYYQATPSSVARDLARAIRLLKTMASEKERERATVFMEGLAQMQSEWGKKSQKSRRA